VKHRPWLTLRDGTGALVLALATIGLVMMVGQSMQYEPEVKQHHFSSHQGSYVTMSVTTSLD